MTTALSSDRNSFDVLYEAAEAANLAPKLIRPNSFESLCPAHPDSRPSLSVDWKPQLRLGGSGVLVKCRSADCAVGDIVASLGLTLAHLFDESADKAPRRDASPVSRPANPVPKKAAPKAQAGKLGHQVAVYSYRDENGAELLRCCRHEPARNGKPKEFIWKRRRDDGRGWVACKSDDGAVRRPLYNLPEVIAAVEAGATVYVVEGEKCADALMGLFRESGSPDVATTCPNGAGSWDAPTANDTHSQWLAGGRVVVVADRDDAGYRHAADVRAKVEAAGAEVVAVLRSSLDQDHADIADHLAASLTLDDLEPVPARELAPPAPVTQLDSRRKERPLSPEVDPQLAALEFTPDGQMPLIRDKFAVMGDSLVKITTVKRGDFAGVPIAVELLSARVRMLGRVRKDMGDGRSPRTSHIDLMAERGQGTELEQAEIPAVPLEEYEKLAWISDLPWPDVTYTRTAAGRSDVINAIARTSGPAVPVTTAYGVLGWREIQPNRWAYVHNGGAIDANGPVSDVRVIDIPDELTGYKLPDPPTEVADFRAAVLAAVRPLEVLPGRLYAPLAGAAFRSCLGPCPATFYVVGDYAAGKSGLAALALQFFVPTASWSNLPTGAGEGAATNVALEQLRYIAGDSVFLADDLAPDNGPQRAASRADALLRSQYNGYGKSRGKRDEIGGSTRPARPPRGTLILTGEDGGTGSAETRCVYLPVRVTDKLPAALEKLDGDSKAAPELKASLIAGMVRHYAAEYPTLATELEAVTEIHSHALRGALDDGIDARRSAVMAHAATGWQFMLDAAASVGAITAGEYNRIWKTAWSALLEAQSHAATAMTGRSLPERAADGLRAALTARTAYIEHADNGGQPKDPEAWGWVAASEPMAGGTFRPAPGARRIGWLSPCGERLWLDDTAAHAAIEGSLKAASVPLGVTPRALGSALRSAGLTVDDGAGNPRRPIQGRRLRVWDVPVTWIYDGDNEPGGDSGPGEPPTDPEPTPEPAPPVLDLPLDHPNPDPVKPAESPSEPLKTPEPASTPSEAPKAAQRFTGPAAQLGARGPAVATDRFRASAVVVDIDGAYLSNGEQIPAPALTDLPAVLAWAAEQKLGTSYRGGHRADDGQLWLMPKVCEALGMGDKPGKDEHPVVAVLDAAGWNLGKGGLNAWSTVWRDGGRALRLAVLSWLRPGDPQEPFWESAELPAATVAARLGRYVREVGMPWRVNGQASGSHLMGLVGRKLPSRPVELPEVVKDAKWAINEKAFSWRRPAQPDELARKRLVALDAYGSYLAAASSTELGTGEAVHLENPAFDPATAPPGWWKVKLPDLEGGRMPNLFDPAAKGVPRFSTDGAMWFCTPTLKAAYDLDLCAPEILDAYVYPEHSRCLEPWYRVLRDARTATWKEPKHCKGKPIKCEDCAVNSAVKWSYSTSIGRLASTTMEGKPLGRVDWQRAVVSQARANTARRFYRVAEQSGMYPIAVFEDCGIYAVDDDLPAGFTVGTGKLGGVKLQGEAPITPAVREALLKPGTQPDELFAICGDTNDEAK